MTLGNNLENPIKSNRILSLSGNGIEGIAELTILAEIEARTGKSTSELFPVITGSGIGGLIGTLLTVPKSQGSTIAKYSAKESLEIFKEISTSIFEYYKYRGMKQELKHRYHQKALAALLNKYIGNTHLSDVTSRLIIPITNLSINAIDAKLLENYDLVDSNSSNYSDLKLQDIVLTLTAASTHINSAQYLAYEVLKKIQDKQRSNSIPENTESVHNVVVALNFDKEIKASKDSANIINNIITDAPNQQRLLGRQLNTHSTKAVELIENILNQGDTYSEIVLPANNYTKQINNVTNQNILALEEISHQYVINHDKELTQLCQILLEDLPRSKQVTTALNSPEIDEGYESDIDIALEKQVSQKTNKQEVNDAIQPQERALLVENAADKNQHDQPKAIFKGWEFMRGKTGGVNDAGEYGGVYKSADGTKLAMIKKEQNPSNNISEYLGSRLFNAVSKGNGAKVSMIAPKMIKKELESGIRNHDLDQKIYVKSEFFSNYSGDMYVDMDRHMSESTKPSSWFRKDGGRPLFMGSRNKLHSTLENAFKELDYQGFEDIMPASLLIGDFDIHLGNIGIIRDNEPKPRMVRIDFAASLQNLTDAIYPHSRLRHLPAFGPTNHYREFPSHLRRKNEALGIKLLEAAKIDLSNEIDSSFEEMSKYYSKDAIISFAKSALPKQFKKRSNTEISIDEIKTAFKSAISKRQESLKEYGMEVLLSTLVEKTATAPYYKINRNKLKALITDNMEYFVDRFIGIDKVKVKVSDQSLRGIFLVKKGAETMLGQEISSILKEVIKCNKKPTLLLNNSTTSNNDEISLQHQDNINRSRVELKHTAKNNNLLDSSNQEQDIYIVKNNVVTSTKSTAQKQGTLTPIIRNEILIKQRHQLGLYLSKHQKLEQFVKDDKSLQDFLSNLDTEHKKLVDEALTNEKLKAELEHIELSGYRKMHDALKDSLQDIKWSNTIDCNIGLQRSQIIKDGGHEVCKLIETTHNITPIVLSKQDGTAVTVNKYRTISFPTKINHATSAMDLAIVALDEMGNRPDKSHAVYFTAHYEAGEDGKTVLTEVSTPIPLKFQGDGADAIGYVEHNGKIYTMPVTRGKYEEMMIEVAKNKGQGLNLSQKIEQEAHDMAKISSPTNNCGTELEDYKHERSIHHSILSVDLKKKIGKSINIAQTDDLPYKSTGHVAKLRNQDLKKYNRNVRINSKACNIKKDLNNNGRTR